MATLDLQPPCSARNAGSNQDPEPITFYPLTPKQDHRSLSIAAATFSRSPVLVIKGSLLRLLLGVLSLQRLLGFGRCAFFFERLKACGAPSPKDFGRPATVFCGESLGFVSRRVFVRISTGDQETCAEEGNSDSHSPCHSPGYFPLLCLGSKTACSRDIAEVLEGNMVRFASSTGNWRLALSLIDEMHKAAQTTEARSLLCITWLQVRSGISER